MSLALTQRVKDLEKKVELMERTIILLQQAMESVGTNGQEARLKELENKYRMLNARISRKNADVA